MKKLCRLFRSPSTFKYDLKMKLSTLFILVAFFTLQAKDTYGQRTKITLNLSDVSVGRLIDEIESSTEFQFVYKLEDVELDRVVSIDAKKEKITTVLGRVFLHTKTTFNVKNRRVYLIKRPDSDKLVTPKQTINTASIEQTTITGTVFDKNGQPLPGANILEKGTTNGTQTDFDGNFTLVVASENATLVISYLGFRTTEVAVNGQTNLSISLEEDAAGLDEVVVVGYGTTARKDVTGAISSVGGEDFENVPVESVDKAIQGRLAGVQVVRNGGAPGASTSIRIRGAGTVNNSEPLYIIDGVPTAGINGINPNNIKSIEVLKDASASAIYGTRAANGVVIVTTKKGEKRRTQCNGRCLYRSSQCC